MKIISLLVFGFFALTIAETSLARDCDSISNWEARKVCEGQCSVLGSDYWTTQKLCEGSCDAVSDRGLSNACNGWCSTIRNYEAMKACESCGGGGKWAALYSLGYVMRCN